LLVIFIKGLADFRDFPKGADVIVCLCFCMKFSNNPP
jgi:hypothetical protein